MLYIFLFEERVPSCVLLWSNILDMLMKTSLCFYSKGKGNILLTATGFRDCITVTMNTFLPGQVYLPDPVFMIPSYEEPRGVGFLAGPLHQAYRRDQTHLNSNGECWAYSDTLVQYIISFYLLKNVDII